jgi:ribosomal protein S18 acetylase RimI-like enzyme
MTDQFEWRPIRSTDAPSWAGLLAATREADNDWEYFTVEDLLEDFDNPSRDFEHGSVVVFCGESMVAYGALNMRSEAEPFHDMRHEGGVHPDFRGRGLGDELLVWAEECAVRLHGERFAGRPLSLSAFCTSTNVGALGLYERRGFRAVRWFNGMIRDISTPLAEIPDLPGIDIVAWTPERSAEALRIRNEAFRDHWGSTETTPESWDHFMASAAFRPDYSFLAVSGGESVGVIICHEYEVSPEATGRELYVSIVGTKRTYRKRGVASALLSRALNSASAAGFMASSLEVDSGSPTGALDLYENLGFKIQHTSVVMRKALA